MRSKMCKRYDVKVRGILGIGTRDVRETEILERSLRWTEECLEYEASDKHRQALLEGLGDESKTVNRVAVKPEEMGQQDAERKKFRS